MSASTALVRTEPEPLEHEVLDGGLSDKQLSTHLQHMPPLPKHDVTSKCSMPSSIVEQKNTPDDVSPIVQLMQLAGNDIDDEHIRILELLSSEAKMWNGRARDNFERQRQKRHAQSVQIMSGASQEGRSCGDEKSVSSKDVKPLPYGMRPINYQLSKALRDGHCVLYVGSGFSRPACRPNGRSLPLWKELLLMIESSWKE